MGEECIVCGGVKTPSILGDLVTSSFIAKAKINAYIYIYICIIFNYIYNNYIYMCVCLGLKKITVGR